MIDSPKIKPLIYISVLNWNGAASTLACLDALMAGDNQAFDLRFIVVDNGSAPEDRELLSNGCLNRPVELVMNEVNLGFAGGHNLIINRAIIEAADYIWLVNNDCLVVTDTLNSLYALISADNTCGIVSPLIVAKHNNAVIDFCGAIHDWSKLDSVCASSKEIGRIQLKQSPNDFFVYGTAPLVKIEALKAVGLLDDKYFAYYEDDDFCTRLRHGGWSIKMEFEAVVQHSRHKSYLDDRPSYFFYLMARNSILFYGTYTPSRYRRFIRLRLITRSMITAQNLLEKSYPEKANACLRGALDGLLGRNGPPRPNVPPPKWFVWVARFFPFRFQQWLDGK